MFSRGTLVCYSDEVGAVSKQAYEMAGARTRVPNALTDFQLDPTLKELSGKGLYPFSISWPDATDATGFGGGGGGRNLVLASSSLKDASTWLRVLSAAVGARRRRCAKAGCTRPASSAATRSAVRPRQRPRAAVL